MVTVGDALRDGDVDWRPTRRGGMVGTEYEGARRDFHIVRAPHGLGWDCFWLRPAGGRTWVCRSVTADMTRLKVEAILRREAHRVGS